MPQRKENEQHPRGSAQQLPSLPPYVHPYQRPHLNPKMMYQTTNPQPLVPGCKSTPWPGAGKMLGNLFEDRNWLLPSNYLDNGNENKTENEPKIVTSVTSPRPPIKEEEEPKIKINL